MTEQLTPLQQFGLNLLFLRRDLKQTWLTKYQQDEVIATYLIDMGFDHPEDEGLLD